jgi:tripartite ATP-independent transporter DctP family solute receptor
MRALRRSHFVAWAAPSLVVIARRFPAGAAEFSYKWANGYTVTHPVTRAMRTAVEAILRDSGGRLEIKLYPANQLGSEASMLLQLRQGALEFMTIAESLSQVIPEVGIGSIPFAFSRYQQAWSAMDGALGAFVQSAIRKGGLYAFPTTFDSGFRQVSNNSRPIAKPEDLKGLKFRVPQSPVNVSTFKALGAEAVALSPADLYTALQTHLVDGVELPMIAFDDFKFFEVLKYMTIWNYQHASGYAIANPDAFSKLPAGLQDLVQRTFREQAMAERQQIVRLDSQLETKLRGAGVRFNRVSTEPFRDAIAGAGLYSQWRQQYASGWEFLEAAVGKL